MHRASTSAFVANSSRRQSGRRLTVVFGARSEWGGIIALHIAPVSGADVVAAFTAAGVEADLWEIGPRRGPAQRVELGALTRRRALELVQGEPSNDACLVADPAAAVTGALGAALSSDRHVTFYARDVAHLSAALATVLSRRLALNAPLPVAPMTSLVAPSEETWYEARSEETERLQVVHLRDVDTGTEAERFVRSRTVDWRAGFSW